MKVTPIDYINKIHRFFKSLKLTATVIALLILIYFLGLVMPQKWMFDTKDLYDLWKNQNILNQMLDWIGFTEIYLSPITIGLLAMFFMNLLVVTISRIPVMLKRAYLMGEMPSFGVSALKDKKSLSISNSTVNSDSVREQLKLFFKKRRWFFRDAKQSNTYFAVKNRLSPIGFILFHLSFFFCLIGGLMITYTRFSGRLPLTEGQKFEGDIQLFRVIDRDPKILKQLPPLWLHLEKVQPFYENDVPTELTASLQVTYRDETEREIIKINEPINRGPMSVIADKMGVSPLFIVRGPGGMQIDAAYISLNVLQGQEDSFQFETDKRFTFIVKFYPDYLIEDGTEKTKSIEMKNPALHLVVGKEGKVIYQGTIKRGEYANLGIYSIGFEDVRYWVEFMVIREYGKYPLIAGFVIAAIGLIMRLVFYQKRLRLAVEYKNDKPVLYIDGRSEYFRYSFEDEMGKLVKELEGFLGKNG